MERLVLGVHVIEELCQNTSIPQIYALKDRQVEATNDRRDGCQHSWLKDLHLIERCHVPDDYTKCLLLLRRRKGDDWL
jgi:hypothetical protein